MKTEHKCALCWDCGQIADDDERSPWVIWSDLKPPANMAVVMGMVKPIPCPNGCRIKHNCSQKDCPNEACYEYTWTKHEYACAPHMEWVLKVSKNMGFSTPENTMRLLPSAIKSEVAVK